MSECEHGAELCILDLTAVQAFTLHFLTSRRQLLNNSDNSPASTTRPKEKTDKEQKDTKFLCAINVIASVTKLISLGILKPGYVAPQLRLG